MGRRAKEFARGMEAGAKPFEEKFLFLGEVIEKLGKNVERHYEDINATMDVILDEMDCEQKRRYFKNNAPVDIDLLEKGDREILLSLLFTVAVCEDNLTEYQQEYLRSVKWHLENADNDKKPKNWSVLKEDDWSILDEITDLDVTKAIALIVMGFLFLGYKNHERYKEEYLDLFECISLNRKRFIEIQEYIDLIYKTMGLQGIAEIYGKAPEEDNSSRENGKMEKRREMIYGTKGELEPLIIDKWLVVDERQEKVYKDKDISFVPSGISNGIELYKDSTVKFINCKITTSEIRPNTNEFFIRMEGGVQASDTQIIFENCTIDHQSIKMPLIDCHGTKTINVTFNECKIENGGTIVRDGNVYIKNTHVVLHPLLNEYKWNEPFVYDARNMSLKDCVFELDNKNNCRVGTIFRGFQHANVENCSFEGLRCGTIFGVDCEIKESIFIDCYFGISGRGNKSSLVQDCIFKRCVFNRNKDRAKFENVEMYDCIGEMPSRELINVKIEGGYFHFEDFFDGIKLIKCQFSNWTYDDYKDMTYEDDKDTKILSGVFKQSTVIEAGKSSEIKDCSFENLQLGDGYLFGGTKNGIIFWFDNCHFNNIQTTSNEILRKVATYLKGDPVTIMKVRDCTGI